MKKTVVQIQSLPSRAGFSNGVFRSDPEKTICFIAVLTMLLGCMSTAWAEDGAGQSTQQGLYGVARTIRSVATVMAVLAIASLGIQMLIGDAAAAAKAKSRIIIISAALAAIYLIFAAITTGISHFPAWSPPSAAVG